MNSNDQGERPNNNETVGKELENLTVQLAGKSQKVGMKASNIKVTQGQDNQEEAY